MTGRAKYTKRIVSVYEIAYGSSFVHEFFVLFWLVKHHPHIKIIGKFLEAVNDQLHPGTYEVLSMQVTRQPKDTWIQNK